MCQPVCWKTWLAQAHDGMLVMPTLAVDAAPLARIFASPLSQLTVCIGPEGDFTRAEAEAFVEHDGHVVSLGPRILRVETAALATLAIIQHEWSRQAAAPP